MAPTENNQGPTYLSPDLNARDPEPSSDSYLRVGSSSQLETGSIHSDARTLVEPDPEPEPEPNAAITQTSSLESVSGALGTGSSPRSPPPPAKEGKLKRFIKSFKRLGCHMPRSKKPLKIAPAGPSMEGNAAVTSTPIERPIPLARPLQAATTQTETVSAIPARVVASSSAAANTTAEVHGSFGVDAGDLEEGAGEMNRTVYEMLEDARLGRGGAVLLKIEYEEPVCSSREGDMGALDSGRS